VPSTKSSNDLVEASAAFQGVPGSVGSQYLSRHEDIPVTSVGHSVGLGYVAGNNCRRPEAGDWQAEWGQLPLPAGECAVQTLLRDMGSHSALGPSNHMCSVPKIEAGPLLSFLLVCGVDVIV
jgi:hypothetical protein